MTVLAHGHGVEHAYEVDYPVHTAGVQVGLDHDDDDPHTWTDSYRSWATEKPHATAVSRAQERVRRDYPTMTTEMGSEDDATASMAHMLRRGGHPLADECSAHRHGDPSRGMSQAFLSEGQFPAAAIHHDRWDYGTLAHETAHHLHQHHDLGGRRPADDAEAHGPGFIKHYQSVVEGMMGRRGGEASQLLGDTYHEALGRNLHLAAKHKIAETTEDALDRINRSIWEPIRAEHQAVHRGFGAVLSDEDHEVVHDRSRPLHERAARLMSHLSRNNPNGSGLGIHWTTDSNVAHHFAKVDASHVRKYDEDADGERYGHDPGGIPRQRPETRVVMHAHFPEHEHIAHEEEDQDGAFRWDERNTMQHTENGGGYGFEREVPIKRGQPVRVHALSWGLASHRSDAEADHDRETTRYDFPQDMIHKASRPRFIYRPTARFTPTKRIFGPTQGLDHRLWAGDHLKHDVRAWILDTLGAFWTPRYGHAWTRWARVYFAGSEASEWTGPDLEGNNDFDVLVGVHYERARQLEETFTGDTDESITARLNDEFRSMLIPMTDPSMLMVEGQETGPWSVTWYVNQDSWDISKIKPYSAYDVSRDKWAVRPPHLPDWSLDDFPAAFKAEARAVEAYVKAVLKLPEPMRTQQADALWRHLHGDRSRAFSAQGEGWIDPGNALEKWLDQAGLWEKLADVHFEAVADPSRLLAPTSWSNNPHTWMSST